MSNVYRWRSNPTILARLVNANDIQTWKSKQVILKPNEACAFIIDGRIGDIVSEKIVRNVGGGLGRYLGDMLGATATDRRMLFAMTGPADISIPFESNLPNGSKVQGFANLRVQIRDDDIPKLLNMFANSAPLLDRERLIKVLQHELNNRVIAPALSQCQSGEDLRKPDFQEQFEMRAEVEMRSTLSTLGFTFLKAFVATNSTDSEKIAQLRSELSAATQTEGAHAEALMERIAIRESATLRRIECEVNVAKAQAAGKVSVEMESELKELRKQEAQWEAELKRDQGRSEMKMKEASHKTEQAMALFEQVQAKKRARINQQHDHQNQRMDKQNDIQMKMMEMAAQNGALTPDVMQEFLKQQTAQKAVDGSGGDMPSSLGQQTNSPKVCPGCGNTVQAEWNACPNCGNSL
jgi:hypothetical protein